MKKYSLIALAISILWGCRLKEIEDITEGSGVLPSEQVSVFLGTSGDHGQLSPSASSPFNMISIGPVTDPSTHTGYEHYAKTFLGFVHTHIEGVGCRGGGGNILIRPFGSEGVETKLLKQDESAQPGYYRVSFENGIRAEMTVDQNYGMHRYHFPNMEKGLMLDLSHAFLNRFVQEKHVTKGNSIRGWVDTKTVCDRGQYRLYFYMEFGNASRISKSGNHQYLIYGKEASSMDVRIGFSTVNEEFAKARVTNGEDFAETKEQSKAQWDSLLGRVQVSGEADRKTLFYSLLYRGLQAPYAVSEPDGSYRAIDGTLQSTENTIYNGWAIWDNYREQMPLLSLITPQKYGNIARSIANMYRFGKNDWSTMQEPSNTVRTEHAQVVLLDALKKNHSLPLNEIKDSLIAEITRLDFDSPDKALESSYDLWAISQLMLAMGDTIASSKYLEKVKDYEQHWKKDFSDMDWPDVDQMGARGLYQGTLMQYRWFVPFDVLGLQDLVGGEKNFTEQLDQFFEGDYYNHANQPDLQVPGLYNTTKQPWKSQRLFRNLMLDTVVQSYFNDNSKGIDPYIGRIYNNRPRAYLRTMDDDLGTMSSWFVLRAMGLSPANVGEPIYYITTPIFKSVELSWPSGKTFAIQISNYHKDRFYIKSAKLNGNPLRRNWLFHEELMNGGDLKIEVDSVPNKTWGVDNRWISKINE